MSDKAKVTQLDTSRIVVRVTREQYALAERAAILEGVTVEQFVERAAVEKAKAVIEMLARWERGLAASRLATIATDPRASSSSSPRFCT